MILEVKNLVKRFRLQQGLLPINRKNGSMHAFNAVDDVSFFLQPGEILGLLGQSGSGKTTLARALMRLIEPDSGTALFENRDIYQMSRAEVQQTIRRRMRMIFQHPEAVLNPEQRVDMVLRTAQQVCSAAGVKPRRDELDQLLAQVGLNKTYRAKYPYELSGGEKRRILICRALISNPTIIFADEPVSGLDVALQNQILDLLLHINEEKKISIVFITHDIGIVHYLCHRVAVMFEGRIVELGSRDCINLSASRHPYTQLLFLSRFTLNGAERETETRRRYFLHEYLKHEDIGSRDDGCTYAARCPIWRKLNKPNRCREQRPKLEQVADEHFVACHFAGGVNGNG